VSAKTIKGLLEAPLKDGLDETVRSIGDEEDLRIGVEVRREVRYPSTIKVLPK
jgi:hypothetical protein